MHEHFGVGVGVEDRAFVLQLATQRHAVGEVSVVPQRHVASWNRKMNGWMLSVVPDPAVA